MDLFAGSTIDLLPMYIVSRTINNWFPYCLGSVSLLHVFWRFTILGCMFALFVPICKYSMVAFTVRVVFSKDWHITLAQHHVQFFYETCQKEGILSHDQHQHQWRKGVLGNAQFPNTRWSWFLWIMGYKQEPIPLEKWCNSQLGNSRGSSTTLGSANRDNICWYRKFELSISKKNPISKISKNGIIDI